MVCRRTIQAEPPIQHPTQPPCAPTSIDSVFGLTGAPRGCYRQDMSTEETTPAADEPSPAFRRGEIFLHRGDLQAARRCFGEALAEARRSSDPRLLVPVLLSLGSVHAGLGDREAARGCFRGGGARQRGGPGGGG